MERRSLLWSSWGTSRPRCERLVAEGEAADREALEAKRSRYQRGAVPLRGFRIERDGNGRDLDIVPELGPGEGASYLLRFEILDAPAPGASVPLASSGFHLEGEDRLRIFVRRSELLQRFPGLEPGRSYRVRATLTLDVGRGGQGGFWSEAFVERVYPARERTTSLVREATL